MLAIREAALLSHPDNWPVFLDRSFQPERKHDHKRHALIEKTYGRHAGHARKQGTQVRLEVWPNMIHNFQAFGDLIPASKEALAHILEKSSKNISPKAERISACHKMKHWYSIERAGTVCKTIDSHLKRSYQLFLSLFIQNH